MKSLNKITVIGIGPGHPDFVLPAAQKAITDAKILVGGRRALADFASENQKTFPIAADIQAVIDFIKKNLAENPVAVLVSGDPGYYSLLDALRRKFPAFLINVIPGISSPQYAFSRLGLPWHDAVFVSFHGRTPEKAALAYKEEKYLGIITDTKYNSQTIPPILIENGWPPSAQLAICSRLSYDDEEIIYTTLENAAGLNAVNSCVLVVGDKIN